jgi:hypothetical protein
MPEGVGYSGVAAKSQTIQTQQAVARAAQDRATQTRDQIPPQVESRKNNPAVEVKLSDEALKPKADVQPRQDIDTVARTEQDRVTQTRDQRPAEPVSRKNNPAVEVKLSDESLKPKADVQPRQDVDTYEALNRKS